MTDFLPLQESACALPPNVIADGEPTSTFDLSISELIWQCSTSAPASAKIIWWGESPNQSEFLKIKPNGSSNSIQYKVQTSLRLFRDYLANCEPIQVQFFTSTSNLLIGTALIRPPFGLSSKNWSKEIRQVQIRGASKSVIGEFCVNFTLTTMAPRARIALKPEDELKLSSREAAHNNSCLRLSLKSIYLLPAGDPDRRSWSGLVSASFTVECRLVPGSNEHNDSWNVLRFYSDSVSQEEMRIDFKNSESRSLRLDAHDNTPTTIMFSIWWRNFGSPNSKCLGTVQWKLTPSNFNDHHLRHVKLLEVVSSTNGLHVANIICNVHLSAKDPNLNTCTQCKGREHSGGGDSAKNSTRSTPVAKDSGRQSDLGSSSSARDTSSKADDDKSVDQAVQTAKSSEMRPLKGLFFAGCLRQTKSVSNCKYSASCEPFWTSDLILDFALGSVVLEKFAVKNDERFLNRVKNSFQTLEVHQRISDSAKLLLGVVRLPLHQFYIAFRDETLASHLCKTKLPVISIDGWSPVVSPESNECRGELQTLLAIGTPEQIDFLKSKRNFEAMVSEIPPAIPAKHNAAPPQLRKTSDLLEVLESALAVNRKTSNSVPKDTKKVFRILLSIESAVNLPRNPLLKNKKGSKRSKQIKFPPNEEPSAYVTFQAEPGYGVLIKSHEGMVYATNIAGKSTNPVWNKQFDVVLSTQYKIDKEKRFILKMWKKATTDLAHCRLYPTPLDDSIVGLSAINLSTLNVHKSFSGWFNIVDFTGRINGQLKIKVTEQDTAAASNTFAVPRQLRPSADEDLELGLADVPLNVAIKRKFVELDQISGRLRKRLLGVTGAPESGIDLGDADDAECDEFERDLNTVCDDDLAETPVKRKPEFDWVNVFSSINLMESQGSSASATCESAKSEDGSSDVSRTESP